MKPPRNRSDHIQKLAVFAGRASDYIHHGETFSNNMMVRMDDLKQAFVLAETLISSGSFTDEVVSYPDARETTVKPDHIRLLQGLVALELSDSDYHEVFEAFPVNARKKLSKAAEYIGRELQILVANEVAYEE